MRKYCRAYHLKALRQFSGWVEKREENEPEPSDEDIVYLWDDFTVVKSPIIAHQDLLFDRVTPEWREFCADVLQFALHEDLRSADEHRDRQDESIKALATQQSIASV